MPMKRCSLWSLVVLLGFLFVISSAAEDYDNDHHLKCSIEKFYVPALSKASNDAANLIINTTVLFDLRLKIEYYNLVTPILGIIYDSFDINLYFYHQNGSASTGDTLIRLPIGNISIPKFRQSKFEKPKHHILKVQIFGVPWEEAKMAVSNGGTAVFGVELASHYEYMYKHYGETMRPVMKVKLGANVTVNDHGNKSVRKGYRLTSAASRRIENPSSFFLLALLVLGLIS